MSIRYDVFVGLRQMDAGLSGAGTLWTIPIFSTSSTLTSSNISFDGNGMFTLRSGSGTSGLRGVSSDASASFWLLRNSAPILAEPTYTWGFDSDTGVGKADSTDSNSFSLIGGGNRVLQVSGVNNAVNFVRITNSATTVAPLITADGTDVNIPLQLSGKGSRGVLFGTNGIHFSSVNNNTRVEDLSGLQTYSFSSNASGAQVLCFRANSTSTSPTSNNYLLLRSVAGGNPPQLIAEGTDANIDLQLTPKGSLGYVRFGTYSTLSGETISGYITIKDASGNVRKLAVVA